MQTNNAEESRCVDFVVIFSDMLGIVTVKRLRTVIVSIILLLIVIVFISNESFGESKRLSIKEPFIQPTKQTLKATTEEYDDYEEIEIPLLWGDFIPTDVRFEKDIFFLETRGYENTI